MARQSIDHTAFTDLVQGAELTSAGLDNISWGWWFYASNTAVLGRFMHGNSGGTGIGIQVNNTAGTVDMTFAGINWFGGGSFTTGQWNHAMIVRNAGTAQLYLNGSTLGSSTATVPNALTGSGVFGTDGVGTVTTGTLQYADLCFYTRVLAADEIAALGKGYSPLAVSRRNLVRYIPLLGRTSPEIELMTGSGLTVTGTTYADHPPLRFQTVSYPSTPYRTATARQLVSVSSPLRW